MSTYLLRDRYRNTKDKKERFAGTCFDLDYLPPLICGCIVLIVSPVTVKIGENNSLIHWSDKIDRIYNVYSNADTTLLFALGLGGCNTIAFCYQYAGALINFILRDNYEVLLLQ